MEANEDGDVIGAFGISHRTAACVLALGAVAVTETSTYSNVI